MLRDALIMYMHKSYASGVLEHKEIITPGRSETGQSTDSPQIVSLVSLKERHI